MKQTYICVHMANNEWEVRKAYLINNCFATFKMGNKGWNVTHTPSGFQLTITQKRADAVEIVTAISALVDWDGDRAHAADILMHNEQVRQLLTRFVDRGIMTRVI